MTLSKRDSALSLGGSYFLRPPNQLGSLTTYIAVTASALVAPMMRPCRGPLLFVSTKFRHRALGARSRSLYVRLVSKLNVSHLTGYCSPFGYNH